MILELDSESTFFRELRGFCAETKLRGLSPRIVGGVAMSAWRLTHGGGVHLTKDFDLALTDRDVGTPTLCRRTAQLLFEVRRALAFERIPDWQEKRNGRTSYQKQVQSDPDAPAQSIGLDLLCTPVSYGRGSRRLPVYHLLEDKDPDKAFSASNTPFLEWVDEWCVVDARIDGASFQFEIPSLRGMGILKLKAVADKVARLHDESDADRITHEEERFQRNANDLVWLTTKMRLLGELSDLRVSILEHPEIGRAARSLLTSYAGLESGLSVTVDGVEAAIREYQ